MVEQRDHRVTQQVRRRDVTGDQQQGAESQDLRF
jgi:hypothetical protein